MALSASRVIRVPAQVDRAVEILTAAFHDDPTWSQAIPDNSRRPEVLRWLWRMSVEGAARYGTAWLSAGGEAASVWIPPGGTEFAAEQVAELEPGLRQRLGDDADRVLRLYEHFESNHPQDRPHHYLSLLGVDPAFAGQGHGMRLLAADLAGIDATGGASYLESSNPANITRYERLGFRPWGEFRPFADGPMVTTMWREAERPAP